MKEIDVLLPFHKENTYLYSAIKSVNQSNNVKVRLLLIDDRLKPQKLTNQPDNSTIIKSFGAGYAGALNMARIFLSSPHVALMNSDDLVHPDRFNLQIQNLVDHNLQLSACGIQKFNKRKFVLSRFGKLHTSGILDRRLLLLGAYGVDATWCGKTDWWKNNLEFTNLPMSDWATGIDVTNKIDIFFDPHELYFYRQHTYQMTAESTFSAHGLETIIEKWHLLARVSGVSALLPAEVAWVAAPRGREPLNKTSIERIARWLNEFNQITNESFVDLIARRYLLLFISYPKYKIELKNILLAVSGANSLVLEKLSNFTKSRDLLKDE